MNLSYLVANITLFFTFHL